MTSELPQCAGPTTLKAQRRRFLEAGAPLSEELVERIERLLATGGEARSGGRAAV